MELNVKNHSGFVCSKNELKFARVRQKETKQADGPKLRKTGSESTEGFCWRTSLFSLLLISR